MINKNSFLDAYGSLNGSYFTNTAMWIAVAALVGSPAKLSDDNEFYYRLRALFALSLTVHSLSTVEGIATLFKATRLKMFCQTSITGIQIWFIGLCLNVHIGLRTLSHDKEDFLNPLNLGQLSGKSTF